MQLRGEPMSGRFIDVDPQDFDPNLRAGAGHRRRSGLNLRTARQYANHSLVDRLDVSAKKVRIALPAAVGTTQKVVGLLTVPVLAGDDVARRDILGLGRTGRQDADRRDRYPRALHESNALR